MINSNSLTGCGNVNSVFKNTINTNKKVDFNDLDRDSFDIIIGQDSGNTNRTLYNCGYTNYKERLASISGDISNILSDIKYIHKRLDEKGTHNMNINLSNENGNIEFYNNYNKGLFSIKYGYLFFISAIMNIFFMINLLV